MTDRLLSSSFWLHGKAANGTRTKTHTRYFTPDFIHLLEGLVAYTYIYILWKCENSICINVVVYWKINRVRMKIPSNNFTGFIHQYYFLWYRIEVGMYRRHFLVIFWMWDYNWAIQYPKVYWWFYNKYLNKKKNCLKKNTAVRIWVYFRKIVKKL